MSFILERLRLKNGLTSLLNDSNMQIIMKENKTCIVYGGFLRDLIAGVKYNDIDVNVDEDFIKRCVEKTPLLNSGKSTDSNVSFPNSGTFPECTEKYIVEKYTYNVKDYNHMLVVPRSGYQFDISVTNPKDLNMDADINSLRVDMHKFKVWFENYSNLTTIPIDTPCVGLDHVINLITQKQFNIPPDHYSLKKLFRIQKLTWKGYQIKPTQHNVACIAKNTEMACPIDVDSKERIHMYSYVWGVKYVVNNHKWISEQDKKKYIWKRLTDIRDNGWREGPISEIKLLLKD